MAKHRSNGHASNGHVNGAVAEPLRAPAGGVRAGGKFYRGGSIMPKRYSRERDPATGMPLTAPNFGRMVLPHAITFVGKQSTVAHVYRNPDEAVLRSGGQSWKMRRDPSIMECLEARQRATALLGWHLEVEDEKDPQQKRLKDEMTKIVKRTYQFTEYRRNLLEAIWYGRYAVQHKFGFANIDGQRRTIIEGWRPINGDKLVFRFDDGSGKYRDDEVGVRVTPVYSQTDALAGPRKLEVTDLGMAYFLQPWERSLVAIHRHIIEDGDYEDPISAGRIHGVGVRDRIYWCWYQKQETMAQLMEVIDRTGSGITIYWYPAGNAQAESDTIALAEKQKHENVLVMPRQGGDPTLDAYGIDRVEPNAGGIEMMSKIVDEFFGDQIMRYICGGTLFSKSKSLGIGGGGADIQEQSFFLIVQYDSIKLEETISHEMVAPLKQFNCPWARDIPLWFKIDTDSPDSLEKLQAAKTLWEMGQKIKGSELMGKVGLSVPADGEDFLQNPAAAPQMGMPGMPGQPGMPGDPTAEGGQQGDMQDLFGPLASEFGGDEGGADDGGEPPQNPPMGGGPAQYAKQGLAAAIEATNTKPTDAQREAGNYAKGKFSWNGLTISIENPAGTKRRPEWKPLAHHYGYINRTEGKDGDHVDVFLGPDLDSDLVVVIDQPTAGGRFDEHKCLIGFTNAEDAAAGYLANYDDGWKLGPVTTMTVEQFKNWLADGDTTKPIEEQVSRYAKRQIRSSPGQQPLPILGDVNTKKHHLWREELHPRDASGQWTEKAGGKSLPKQFGQGMLFKEMAAKLHESEQQADPKAGKSQQKSLFDMLARSDIHPEQVAALLSGDDQRLRDLEKEAIATGQHEHSPQAAEEPSPPLPEPSKMPTAGMPGGEARQDDGDGFSLERQKQKVGRGIGTEDKTPETGGRQESFWHGMGDAEGQGKLFGGLDLAGGDTEPPITDEVTEPESTEKPDEDETPSPMAIAHPDEIPFETALRAHQGTSFVPETRAKQRQQDYANQLNGDYEELSKLPRNDEERKALADEFARYKDGYRRHYLEYLHANSRIVSTMIAGGSNFPVRQMEKRNATAHKRLTELIDFRKRALAAIGRKIRPDESVIKSSDPNAVENLQKKLKSHEDLHARMKAVNAAHKKFLKDPESLDKTDLSDDDKALVRNYKPAYSWEPHPFPPYRLTNNNATIKQVKDRIASVSKMQSSKPKEESHGGIKLVENPEAGRIQLVFPGKPDEKTRAALKSAGFRWAPSEGAWQRHLNEAGRYAASRVLESLKKQE